MVALVEVVRHRVRPLERRAALLHLVDGLLHELHLDPRQVRRHLHLLHLLLRLHVQLDRQLRGLLVVRPAVVVLHEPASGPRRPSCAREKRKEKLTCR